MPPPPTVVCELCHNQFSVRSLPIHQRQCAKKREQSTSFCPVCDCLLSNEELGRHVAECKRVNTGTAAAKKPGAAPRSKIPESVLRRLEAAEAAANGGGGGGANSGVGERLAARGASGPCDACAAAACTVGCVKCDKVFCAPCSDTIHIALLGGQHEPLPLPESQVGEGNAMLNVEVGGLVCLA